MTTLTWPDYLIIKSIDTINNVSTVSSEARNKKILNRTLTGQRFDFNIRMNVAPWNAKKASGFLFALQDDDVVTEYTDVSWLSDASNTTVNGAVSAGGRDVVLDDVTDVSAGDWLNFGGHDKLYKILYLVGNTVTLNTGLLFSVTDAESVELASPKAVIELAPELKSSSTFSDKLHRDLSSFNARFVEVL